MKKILFGLIALLIIIGGSGYAWYKVSYGGTAYYIKITEDGKKIEQHDDAGNDYTRYEYKQDAYEQSGASKQLEFTADHNLRHGAYLELTNNKVKGVTNWKEISKSDVPKKALNKLK